MFDIVQYLRSRTTVDCSSRESAYLSIATHDKDKDVIQNFQRIELQCNNDIIVKMKKPGSKSTRLN